MDSLTHSEVLKVTIDQASKEKNPVFNNSIQEDS